MKRALFLTILFPSILLAAPEKVTIKTPDGTALQALFSKPATGKSTVIMLHGLASVKEEWNPLIDALVKSGFGILAYDSRPRGTPWEKLVDDVGAVFRYLEKEKQIDRTTIILAGASLGANVCLKYAALTGNGKAVLLLSPGLNYQGLTTDDVIGKIKSTTPVLIVVSPADTYAYQSSMRLIPLTNKGDLWASVKPGHGVQMFDDDLLKRLVAWLGP